MVKGFIKVEWHSEITKDRLRNFRDNKRRIERKRREKKKTIPRSEYSKTKRDPCRNIYITDPPQPPSLDVAHRKRESAFVPGGVHKAK